ncbi:MAG TPA: sialate O-acetylesterase, partial [Thermoanaerobaculia bacterium]|nr:sialate O-acetylesterase [Thermoanaerobaculia bacterium]
QFRALRVLAMALATVMAATSVHGVRLEPEPPLDLFLLAGQSNMAGRGVVEAEDRVPNPRVWMLNRSAEWAPAVDPLHFDKPIAGVGPGRSFGLAIAAANPAVRVGLVPVAVGGSPIATWRPGVIHTQTGTKPYDDALNRVRAAKRMGEFRAVLWHQGESDATAESAPSYESNLRSVIERLRSDLGSPAIPVLIGQLGRFAGHPWTPLQIQVDAAHRRLASEMRNVAFVSSADLVDKGDGVHFDSASARMLGRRYAEAYWSMTRR